MKISLLKTVTLGSLLTVGVALAQPRALAAQTTATQTKPQKTAATPKTGPASASDIADAKSKGLVWVNLNTKVYHASKDKEYGTTKNGKFMSEADAKATGARAAKN